MSIDKIKEEFRKEMERIIELDGCCRGDLCNGSKSHNDSLVDQFLELFKKRKEGIKAPRENTRGYIVEGEPCHFCKGTGKHQSTNILC